MSLRRLLFLTTSRQFNLFLYRRRPLESIALAKELQKLKRLEQLDVSVARQFTTEAITRIAEIADQHISAVLAISAVSSSSIEPAKG